MALVEHIIMVSRNRYWLALGTLAYFTACQEFVDEPQPEATVAIAEISQSADALDAALTGAWAWWTAPQGYVGNAIVYPEALADYLENTYERGERATDQAYRRDAEGDTYGLLGEYSQRISRAENLATQVITAARTQQPTGEDWPARRDRILGEGLFLRSWIHFEYIKMSADPWNTQNPGANREALGPLIRFTSIRSLDDLAQARTPLAVAYDSTIRSLQRAEQLLPECYVEGEHSPSFRVRANRDAASTLLAKVYWQQNDFDKALAQINRVIGETPGQSDYPLAENFADVYQRRGITGTTNAKSTSEVILEYVAREPSKLSTRNGQTLSNAWWREEGTSLYFGAYFQELANFDTVNDRRYRELINPRFTQVGGNVTPEDSAWSTLKFVADVNLPIFRSAELLLMRAEILARRGQTAGALADLNYVRSRAGIAPITETTGLVDEIIEERIREMHAEGYRSHELKRLGSLTDGQPDEVYFLPGGRSGSLDCSYPGACDPIKWNSRMLIWNIPQGELDVNPLAENP